MIQVSLVFIIGEDAEKLLVEGQGGQFGLWKDSVWDGKLQTQSGRFIAMFGIKKTTEF